MKANKEFYSQIELVWRYCLFLCRASKMILNCCHSVNRQHQFFKLIWGKLEQEKLTINKEISSFNRKRHLICIKESF